MDQRASRSLNINLMSALSGAYDYCLILLGVGFRKQAGNFDHIPFQFACLYCMDKPSRYLINAGCGHDDFGCLDCEFTPDLRQLLKPSRPSQEGSKEGSKQ